MQFIGGKRLISYTLDTAKQLDIPVAVFTDHPDIVKLVSAWYPAFMILDQPETIQEEKANNNQWTRYLLDNIPAKNVILLPPTHPVRSWTECQNWINSFVRSDCDCGLSVTENRKYLYNEAGDWLNQIDRLQPNPEKPVIYQENGGFYIFNSLKLRDNHIVHGKKMFFIDQFETDIDTDEDIRKENILIAGGYYENKSNC
jgi:CMP-N-acetylneuraminic acid synthetase